MKNIVRWGMLLFIFALPLGTKKFIAPLIPQLFDYTREFSSLFLYATDVLALVLVGFVICYGGTQTARMLLVRGAIAFCVLVLASLSFALNIPYSLYNVVELAIALAAACALAFVVRERLVSMQEVCVALGASATFQAMVAIGQFFMQKSVGLPLLGEVVVTAATKGVARVTIGGISFLRAYGTLPHANILAGFLVMGLIACAYLYLTASRTQRAMRIASAFALFLMLVALVFTFSRSGWLVAAVSACVLGVYAFWNKALRTSAYELALIALASIIAITAVLGWAIAPRAGFAKGEASVDHRVYYNEIGIALIRAHPWGVGLGNEVLQAAREGLFTAKGLRQPWLWQPVHNIYILIASELGIAGLLVFLIFVFLAFRRIRLDSPDAVFAGLLVFSLLLFGLVDHFPWDLHAGRLMFWVTFGMLAAVTNAPRGESV